MPNITDDLEKVDARLTEKERELQTPSYIARCPVCSGMVMAVVDTPEHKADTAKEIGRCIRQGYIIERVTVQYVRENWKTCDCLKAKRKAKAKRETGKTAALF